MAGNSGSDELEEKRKDEVNDMKRILDSSLRLGGGSRVQEEKGE